MLGQKRRERDRGVAAKTEETRCPALTCAATAVPRPLRRRFHQNRCATVSFLDRATSSPGIRTFWTASHIAYRVPGEDDQCHKTPGDP